MTRVTSIALLGFGNVGRALSVLLANRRDELKTQYGIEYRIAGVASRRLGYLAFSGGVEPHRPGFAAGAPGRTCANLNEWLVAAQPDVVFEMTPTDAANPWPAVERVRAALHAGAHVVSANKGPNLVAYHELCALAESCGRSYLFEASCMGGVPLFALFRETLPLAHVRRFRGLLNCTTSVVLHEMALGRDFAAGIAKAQSLGVAEADYGADIDGWDCAVKLCAIGNVLMNAPLPLAAISVGGIRELAPADVREAHRTGRQIRLISELEWRDERLHATVRPQRLEPNDPLFTSDPQDIIGTFDLDLLNGLTLRGHRLNAETTAYDMMADFVRVLRRRSGGRRCRRPHRAPRPLLFRTMINQSPLIESYVEEILHFWEPNMQFGTPLVVLRQKGGNGRIMILTDQFRTKEIIMALEGHKHERPLTLDFAKNGITTLGGTVMHVCIATARIKEMNYMGQTVVVRGDEELIVESRPSDALALALKEKVPIYVREECFGTLNEPLCGYAPISHIWPFRKAGYEWVREAAVRRQRERDAAKAAAAPAQLQPA